MEEEKESNASRGTPTRTIDMPLKADWGKEEDGRDNVHRGDIGVSIGRITGSTIGL